MKQTIWKFPVLTSEAFALSMPRDARVLTVQTQGQDGPPFMWVLVEPSAPIETRKFRLFGTGHPVESDDDLEYVGTFQQEDGHLVFHLFESTDTALTPIVATP